MIRIARSVAAALALAVAAPSVALADAAPGTPPAARQADAAKDKNKGQDKAKDKDGKRGKDKNNFPMKAATFKDHMEKRIAKARTKIGEALERHNVPAAVRTEVMKDFEAGATTLRAAADRASKDGEVTKAEADEVKNLAKDLKQKARAKYGLGGKGKGKGKGKQV